MTPENETVFLKLLKAGVSSLNSAMHVLESPAESQDQDHAGDFAKPDQGTDERWVGLEAELTKQASPAPTSQRLIPWGGTVSPEFLLSCLWIEEQIGLKPENLLPCMKFESNLNPAAKNPMSSGSGLIQFMDSTAKRLGTTTTALRAMNAVTQLSYVYRYFKEYHDRGFPLGDWSLEDTYMAILWPAAIGKPLDYRVFVNDPNRLKDAYDVNKGLDVNKDGFITKKEACARVVKLAAEGTAPNNVGFV